MPQLMLLAASLCAASGRVLGRTMTPDTFTTETLLPGEQLEAWQEWYQPVFDVIPRYPAGKRFVAEIHLWKLGGLAMSRTSAPPVHVVRTMSHLRRDAVDHWV